MSEISGILNKLSGTQEKEILLQVEKYFLRIKDTQSCWYEKSQFFCPAGCGECCRDFEPYLLDCEALYVAAWLLENQSEVAKNVALGKFPFERQKGCQFWSENEPHHCTIYGGRVFICRLFGASAVLSKTGAAVFKICKFFPDKKLCEYKSPLQKNENFLPVKKHRQYSQKETEEIFGTMPPVMSDLMEEAENIEPDSHETKLMREILPQEIRRLEWIISLNTDSQKKAAE